MVSLILAAGYATRLYPLTKNFPKPLLKIGSNSILDRIITDIDRINEIDKHIIVTNNVFYLHFLKWKENANYQKKIEIVNDGSNSNETRLGAVNDILLVIDKFGITEDLMVLAGDNVVDFSFENFVNYSKEKSATCISYHFETSIDALKKTGVIVMDENKKVKEMHEKPQNPPTHYAVPPFYIYNKRDLDIIRTSVENGCGHDAPGSLVSWLCRRTDVFAWEIHGNRYDVGDIKSYYYVKQIFEDK